jgi:hypothetical protein
MDGRPHPPEYAQHTWGGFSTGEWIGDILKIRTTHLKQAYVRLNGAPYSDQTTLTEYWMRRGDVLTAVMIVEDPVYLERPFIRSVDRVLDLGHLMAPYPCAPVSEIYMEKGVVPHWLPGENPYLNEYADQNELPREAPRSRTEGLYPEYQLKLKQLRDQGR